MRRVILTDDPNVSLVEELERRPLWDDESILERSVDQDGAGLTVTQQAVRVRKIRPEGDVPGLVVELGLDRTIVAWGLPRTLSLLASLSSIFWSGLVLLRAGHVFEVLASGTLK